MSLGAAQAETDLARADTVGAKLAGFVVKRQVLGLGFIAQRSVERVLDAEPACLTGQGGLTLIRRDQAQYVVSKYPGPSTELQDQLSHACQRLPESQSGKVGQVVVLPSGRSDDLHVALLPDAQLSTTLSGETRYLLAQLGCYGGDLARCKPHATAYVTPDHAAAEAIAAQLRDLVSQHSALELELGAPFIKWD